MPILTDSPEFPGKLTIAGIVKMCGNDAKVTSKSLMEIGKRVYKGPVPVKYLLAIRIQSFLSRGEFDALRLLVTCIKCNIYADFIENLNLEFMQLAIFGF